MRISIDWITILSINNIDKYPFYISGNVTHSVYISSLDLPHSMILPLCQIPSKLRVKLSSEAKSNDGFHPKRKQKNKKKNCLAARCSHSLKGRDGKDKPSSFHSCCSWPVIHLATLRKINTLQPLGKATLTGESAVTFMVEFTFFLPTHT